MNWLGRTLANLRPGESGRVQAVAGPAGIRHRLLEMGLTRGTVVSMIRVAPLGDPIELLIRGYHLSVRRAEATAIMLEGE